MPACSLEDSVEPWAGVDCASDCGLGSLMTAERRKQDGEGVRRGYSGTCKVELKAHGEIEVRDGGEVESRC